MGNKELGRRLIAVFTSAVIMFAVVSAVMGYLTAFKKTEIITSVSEDGRWKLIVYMIGEPEWPFGSTHCQFDLFHDSKRLIKHSFSIRDDGAVARERNFKVIWNMDHVTIIVSGSEQKDELYVLNFDGTVG